MEIMFSCFMMERILKTSTQHKGILTCSVFRKSIRLTSGFLQKSSYLFSQHKSILVNIGVVIPFNRISLVPRWNFKKADWNKLKIEVDAAIQPLPLITNNYRKCVNMLHQAAKNCFLRGFRKHYVPY